MIHGKHDGLREVRLIQSPIRSSAAAETCRIESLAVEEAGGFSQLLEVSHQAFAHARIKALLSCKKLKKKILFRKVEVFLLLARSETSQRGSAENFAKSESRLVYLRRRAAELAPNAL